MMDIKHLHRSGLLGYDGETFEGVVAVTYNAAHFAEAMKRTNGRPQLLLNGDIDQLLTQDDTLDAKRLRAEFPFQVINLDYTNSLFGQANTQPISQHLQAIEEVIRLQHRRHCENFALFVTTRAEQSNTPGRNQFTKQFLRELSTRIHENLQENPEFADAFKRSFGHLSASGLLAKRYDAFVPVGISKLIAGILAAHSYEIVEAQGRMLVRDAASPVRWLLHLAFHICPSVPPRAAALRELGRTRALYCERTLAAFVSTVGNGNLVWLRESADGDRLMGTHGDYVQELASHTLDLKIPEPRSSG